MAEAIGVMPEFCQGGDWPKLTDPGLAERIARHPLPEGGITGGGIMAIGEVGTHKTHLLAARTIEAAWRGYSARLINWAMFAIEVRDTYKKSAKETELDVLNRYTGLDYLAIDDLGVGAAREGKESEAARVLAYLLLNKRKEMLRTTDISSNYTPEELVERFDPAIGRRLRKLCVIYPMLSLPTD